MSEEVGDPVEEEEGEHGHVLAVVNVGELAIFETGVELTNETKWSSYSYNNYK